MMKNKKLFLSGLSAMLIMAMVVTAVSFSLAKLGKSKTVFNNAPGAADVAPIDKYTNIDNIISFSNKATAEEPFEYVVVEVYSDTPSELKTMCETRDADGFSLFEKYVINGNKSQQTQDIKPGDVIYYGYKASEFASGDNSDKLAVISGADFLYVSNKGGKFSKTNDIPEDLYQVLNTFAISKYKPVMIDSPTGKDSNTGNTGIEITGHTILDLISGYFGIRGKYYYTYAWDTAKQSVSEFLSHSNGSMYLKIDGSYQLNSGYWTELPFTTTDADGVEQTEVKYMANYLVISDAGGRTLSNLLFTGATSRTAAQINYAGGDAATAELYEITGTSLAKNGYNQNLDVPDYAKVTRITLSELESNTAAYDFNAYDMVIMESDLEGKNISDDAYSYFIQEMYAKAHITYASNLGKTEEVPTPSNPGVIYNETNYKELFYNLATADEITRYDSVMVTTASQIESIAKSNQATEYKPIADLINNSSFRGMGGASATSNMFSVLEIQPCYPIDESVAAIKGEEHGATTNKEVVGDSNYYTKPSDVVNGKSKEQIDEGIEYYAWELSKAKVADLFNLSVDQVNLVQMSTEELACSKVDILGTYDLVYIGGNTTALKSIIEYKSFLGQNNSYKSLKGYYQANSLADINNDLTILPTYTMYTHNGDIVDVDMASLLREGGIIGGTALGNVIVDGERKSSFTMLNGNDITYNKFNQLIQYIDADMPVIVSDDAALAYDTLRNFGYRQNSLDPDSYMSQILAACYTERNDSDNTRSDVMADGTINRKNVLWGFDKDATETVVDEAGTLGTTLTGLFEVFKATSTGAKDAKDVMDLYNASNKRPKLTVTSMPTSYDLYNKNTVLKNSKFTYTIKVTGSNSYNVYLLVDLDGNSRFDMQSTKELKYASDEPITESEFTFDVDVKKTGSVYWQLVVEDTDSGSTVSYTDLCMVKESAEKQKVNVLQLMPKYGKGEGAEGENTLYFCPICQQAYRNLKYEPAANTSDRKSYGAMYGGNYADSSDGKVDKVYYGKHEHHFGIPIYDSTAKIPGQSDDYGCDDWDTNLADQLSDNYDFDIDIMCRDQFEEMAVQIQKAYQVSDSKKQEVVADFESKLKDKKLDYKSKYGSAYEKLDSDEEKYVYAQSVAYKELSALYEELSKYMSDADYDLSNLPVAKVVISKKDNTHKTYRVYDSDGNEITITSPSRAVVENAMTEHFAASLEITGTSNKKVIKVTDNNGNELTNSTHAAAVIMNAMIERYIENVTNNNTMSGQDSNGNWMNPSGLTGLFDDHLTKESFLEQLQWLIDTERYTEYFSIAKALQSNNYGGADVSKPYLAYYQDANGNLYSKDEYDSIPAADRVSYYDHNGNLITSEMRNYGTADNPQYNNDTYYYCELTDTYHYNFSRWSVPNNYYCEETNEIYYNQNQGFKLYYCDGNGQIYTGYKPTIYYFNGEYYNSKPLVWYSAAIDEYFTLDDLQAKGFNQWNLPYAYELVNGEYVFYYQWDNKGQPLNLTPYEPEQVEVRELEVVKLTYKEYYYNNQDGQGRKENRVAMITDGYADYLDDYVIVKDLETEFRELAKLFKYYANRDEWISASYSSIIIGPSEDFAGDDFTDYNDGLKTYEERATDNFKGQGLRDLVSYVDKNGQVLLFHNTLTPSTEGTINLTNRLRTKFGQDVYHMNASDTSTYNVEYSTSSSTEKYFLTDITSNYEGSYAEWKAALENATRAPQGSITISKYKSAIGYTDITSIGGAGTNPYSIPYKYAEFSWSLNRAWNMAASFSADNGNYGTNRATQNNNGVITKYPFSLGAQLNIGGTHPQYYAADIESDKLTVWYSLAGGTNSKEGSSLEAATPKDGKDNYFIYSYGNIFYCAAGHSKITGAAKDNNDERKLYLNIICNSVDDQHDPELIIADYQSYDDNGEGYTNTIVKKEYSGRSYSIMLNDLNPNPVFSFKVDVDSSSSISSVEMYYDTAVTDADARKAVYTGSYTGADTQTKINFTKTVNDEVFCDVGTDVVSASTVPFGGKDYVYMVIRVTDSNGRVATRLIKIKKEPFLYDLT